MFGVKYGSKDGLKRLMREFKRRWNKFERLCLLVLPTGGVGSQADVDLRNPANGPSIKTHYQFKHREK